MHYSDGYFRSSPCRIGIGIVMAMNWYCLQVTANRMKGFEESLQRIRDDESVASMFGEYLSPSEEVVEIKKGKRKISQRKFFTNYVFLEMEMNERTYNMIKRLPMIKGFIGGVNSKEDGWQQPEPVSSDEIYKIRQRVEEGVAKPKPKVMFENGETVRIKSGSFTNFTGQVVDVNYETNRIKVTVNVFNRPSEIQTDFENVEKT